MEAGHAILVKLGDTQLAICGQAAQDTVSVAKDGGHVFRPQWRPGSAGGGHSPR